jgi:DNA excision repair protein ERCC-5
MEAEAQCAKLAELGLVDGIITDDSDVFLFGGTQCFKNIFNDNKYAECFLSTDIHRELSLGRERLISLAYLLGSDYTIGLPGVGPVVALELLSNFPGERGIENFKEWWGKVQTGRDGEETDTKWKISFVSCFTRKKRE